MSDAYHQKLAKEFSDRIATVLTIEGVVDPAEVERLKKIAVGGYTVSKLQAEVERLKDDVYLLDKVRSERDKAKAGVEQNANLRTEVAKADEIKLREPACMREGDTAWAAGWNRGVQDYRSALRGDSDG